jgi:hypothetical protein
MAKQITIAAVVCLFCLLALAPQSAHGQAVYGSILGTVTDPQGAAVANAKVTVINQNKGTTDSTTTNESGNYSATHLVPDVYTVRIEAPGFKTSEHKNVSVSADTGTRVDAQVQLGGTSETVEVTAETPQLKTDRADVAIEFSSKQVSDLPILNRNFQSLELLTPGTQTLTGWAHAATENPQGSKQIFVDGQHFSGTGYMLDGTDNQDPILGIIIVNPSLDTVTETKMATQNYDAEFGKATAGIMTAQTKSGSNSFHGSGYFYDLNPKGPAKDPFSGAPASSTWKQFGAAVGGPIIKNKLFFFGGYEANRRTAGISILATVPTQYNRDHCLNSTDGFCDLSDYSNANLGGGAGVVFNPYQPAGSRQSYTTGTAGNYVTRIPFTDLQQWDPTGVAENILKLLPAPNAPGTNDGTVNNYSAGGSGSFNDYQYTTREDYNPTQKLQIFGRYTHAHFSLSGSPMFGNTIGGPGLGYLGLAGQSNINNYSLATGFNYTVTNTLLTDFRFGWFRYNPHSTKWDAGASTAASDLGLVGVNIPSDPTTNGLPSLWFEQTIGQTNQGGSEHGLGEGLNVSRCNCPLIEKEQGFQFTNNWTKLIGNHQIKIGADLRHATNLRVPSDANRTGQYNFQRASTSDGLLNATGGLDIATFLFGAVSHFDRYVGSPTEANAQEHQNRYFIYAQDTFRATHKLTLNYGIRWEFYSPESVNAKGNGGFAVLPQGVIRVAGYDGISMNGNTHVNLHLFAPRFGVAYEVNPKTVVRMGYGRSFDIGVFGSNFGHTVTQNLPVLAHQFLNSPTNDDKTIAFNMVGTCLPASGGYDPTICGPQDPQSAFPAIPSSGILPLWGPCDGGLTPDNPCLGSVQPHIRPDRVVVPTVDAWNITVQRQVTSKATIQLAYIGTHGSHVFKGQGPSYNLNQPTVVGFDQGLSYNDRAPLEKAFITPYTDANGVVHYVQCCSGFGFDYRGNDGSNSYKAFQVKWNQRATNGLTLMAHYTYSRSYDNDGSYQPDLNVMWGRSDFNRDSVLVLTSIYELPFGRGKSYLGNIGRAADLLVGGWEWNSAITVGSGLPWTPSYNECNADRDTGPCRPNLTGSFNVGIHGSGNNVTYFTPVDPLTSNGSSSGPFTRPTVGTFGNIRRNSFTGPGEFKADMSIYKNFTITEQVKAQFQAEFFNVFNHPVYAFNVNQTGSGTCIDCGGSGAITATEGSGAPTMRQFQFGFRVTF